MRAARSRGVGEGESAMLHWAKQGRPQTRLKIGNTKRWREVRSLALMGERGEAEKYA